MRYLFLVTILLITNAFNAQLKRKTADKLFARMEYFKCEEMYAELAAKCIKGKKNADWEVVRRAAICNSKLFRTKKSIKYYQELQKKGILTEQDRESFIHTLRLDGSYAVANNLIEESIKAFPNNQYLARLNENKENFNTLFLDSSFYRIKESNVNSGKGDFAPNFYNNGIIYASASKNSGILNPRYGWDNAFFINLLHAEYDKDSVLQSADLMKKGFISRAHDGPVSFDSTETMMVITKNRLDKRKGKEVITLSLYFSKKVGEKWGALIPFEYNDASYNVGHGNLSADGKTLYFSSNMPGGIGEADIYVSRLIGDKWSTPENLGPTINTEKHELFPFVENNRLYFASNGHYGFGGMDNFEVELGSGIAPKNIGFPINSAADDFGYIITTNERTGFFTSNRENFIDNIYSFTKRPIEILLECTLMARYKVLEPIQKHKIFMKDEASGKIDTLMTDEFGKIKMKVPASRKYTFTATKRDFRQPDVPMASTFDIRKDSTVSTKLILYPTTIIIQLRVVEKETKDKIPYANCKISDYAKGTDTTLLTNEDGMVAMKVDRDKLYWAQGSKKGFVNADASFNTGIGYEKVIELQLQLPRLKKGDKFKLENIFYDLNKATLRPESMMALDNLAEFVLKNKVKIELSAHTDARGSDAANQKLSAARAESCVVYLIQKGVPANWIIGKGYGESQLINSCKNGVKCTEDLHQANRRTEVKVLEVYNK
jgi:outer membrane protein OmpA-like peptidoglycan-associated protein